MEGSNSIRAPEGRFETRQEDGLSSRSQQRRNTRMRTIAFVLLTLVTCGIAYGQSESDIRDRIVGTWKLVWTEQTMKDGTHRPSPTFGRNAKGFLMYERDGFMCADLVNPDRPKWADPQHPTGDEKSAAFLSKYLAASLPP